MISSQNSVADNLSCTYDAIDPTKNDAPLDFNKQPKKIAVIDLEATSSGVSSSVDSQVFEKNINDKGSTSKDFSFSSVNQRRASFDLHREYRKSQDCLGLSCKETPDVTVLRNSSRPPILSTSTFINPNSIAQSTTNANALGTSIIQAVGVEPAQWPLGSPTSLNPAPFGQSSATLGPAFGAMGVGDPNLLGVMGMSGFGQFGFMRSIDNSVATVLGTTGSSNIVGSPLKDVIQLTNCVLYPPKANQPAPTTRDRPPGCKTVFVGGLPEKCGEDTIKEIFSPCGEISTIRMSKKNFCHIRFENESNVDSAICLSGYRIKIKDVEDSVSTSRILVDYAQARDDQYEWECRERAIQRELRHRERLEQERLRPPSPPTVVHYSDHEASLLTEKLKCEESFQKAAQVLMTWLDRGELSKKNGGQFYSMLQSTNSHIRRLINEKTQHEEELNHAKELLKQRMQGIYLQFHQIEKVFLAASHQKVWDHFTKAQRKNIDTWRKQAEEIKNAQLEEILNEREESEMDLSDEDVPEGDSNLHANKKQKTGDSLTDFTAKLNSSTTTGNTNSSKTLLIVDEEISRAKEENELLRCQLEAYRNEVEVLRSEAIHEKETSDKRLKLLQQALQGMQHQLLAINQQKTRDDEEILQLKGKLTPGNKSAILETTSQSTEVTSNNFLEQSFIPEISSSTNFVQVTEKEVKFIGLIAAFLNVHHFGASSDYIWSYLQHLDSTLQTRDVENLLNKFPNVFKQEVSGVGAKMERKWKFCGFS